MSRTIALFAALALVPAALCAAPTVDIRDVRLSNGPDGTRVVIELSGHAEHTLFSLENPDRVVIDIASAALRTVAPAGQGVVRQLRFGERAGGNLRVVLDLSQRAQARSSVIAPAGAADLTGYRLVIDLGGSGTAVPPTVASAAAAPTPVKAAHAPQGLRDLVIAVDAGHGGQDPGAVGRSGTREKDVALAIARALARDLNREPGMRAILTRDGDYFVSLRDRRSKSRQHNADLFVSVHADAIRDRNISGSSVYILSNGRASSEAARWLADRENAADLVGGVSLGDKDNLLASVLLDLSQTATLTASLSAAEQVLDELHRIGQVRKPQIQQAGFAVLTAPDVPSMLVETAYISNASDERRLRDPAYQQRIAAAIHGGIRRYFHDNPPPGTQLASLLSVKRIAAGGSP